MAYSKITRGKKRRPRNETNINRLSVNENEHINSCIAAEPSRVEPNEIMIINAMLNRSLSTILRYDFSLFGSSVVLSLSRKSTANYAPPQRASEKKIVVTLEAYWRIRWLMRINEWKQRTPENGKRHKKNP